MKTIFNTFLLLIAFTLPIAAQAGHGNEAYLKKVESKYVCMINNQLFDKPQIPVEVDGKTYYGCCPMCEAKLKQSVQARTATDPVSGATVDKATAIIGAQADGVVHYFESEENLKKYDGKQADSHQHNAKQCMQGEDCPMHDGMKHPGKGKHHGDEHHDMHNH